jgi:hypothetical protein
MKELMKVVDNRQEKYHFYNLHEAINFLTLVEVCATVRGYDATLGVSIHSYMVFVL